MSRPPIYAKLKDGLFRPFDAYDRRLALSLPDDKVYKLNVTLPRSTRNNSKYWVTLANVLDLTRLGDVYGKPYSLHRASLITTGHTEPIVQLDTGEVFLHADSAAFDAMDQPEFSRYFDQSMAAIAAQIGCDPLSLRAAT